MRMEQGWSEEWETGPGIQGLVVHGKGLGFCSECDGKHLQGLKWENEKIPQLPWTMGQQTSCCRHPDERCWTLISFSHS